MIYTMNNGSNNTIGITTDSVEYIFTKLDNGKWHKHESTYGLIHEGSVHLAEEILQTLLSIDSDEVTELDIYISNQEWEKES